MTSVKVHHAPGGASSFQLGGGYEPEQAVSAVPKPDKTQEEIDEERRLQEEEERRLAEESAVAAAASQQTDEAQGGGGSVPNADTHTSVKMHHPPGGASSITF